jgi:hypothetical protein
MSETNTTPTGQKSGSLHPAGLLLNLIVTLLTPMFLTVAGGDPEFARAAAAETLASYRAETHNDLITIAKIIAFGLATLGSLSLSMDDGRSLSQILRLRSNASATDRAEHRNRLALDKSRAQKAAQPPPEPEIDTAALAAAAAEMQKRAAENLANLTPQPDAERQYAATWAASAAQVASETAASLDSLPPDERRGAAIWVDVLNDIARDFMAGDIPPRTKPGDLAALLRGA